MAPFFSHQSVLTHSMSAVILYDIFLKFVHSHPYFLSPPPPPPPPPYSNHLDLKMSVKVHPDKHPQFQAQATEAFQKTSEAYGNLKDAPARKQYAALLRDRQRQQETSSPSAGNDFGWSSTDTDTADDGGAASDGPGGARGQSWPFVGRRKGNGGMGMGMQEAAAFFAAAFAAEQAFNASGVRLPGGVAAVGEAGLGAVNFAATLKGAEVLLRGGEAGTAGERRAERMAAGLMVAEAGMRLGGALGRVGGVVGRVGGGFRNVASAVVLVGALGSIGEQLAVAKRDGGGGGGEWSDDEEAPTGSRGRGPLKGCRPRRDRGGGSQAEYPRAPPETDM